MDDKKCQKGFFLIEAVLAMVLLSLVFMSMSPRSKLNGDSRYSVAVADAFERADVIAAAWAVKHIGEMMTVGPTSQDMDAAAVAVDVGATEFDTSKLPRGMTVRVRATLSPAGCTGAGCSVEWLAYTSGGAKFSPGAAAQVLRALGARGAASTPENPTTLTSWHARWSVANPEGAVANTIATRGVYAQTSAAQSIRTDGTSELVADWNVGQNANGIARTSSGQLALGEAGAATAGGACDMANATALAADGVTTLACVGGVWTKTHAADVIVAGTTTSVNN